MNVAILKQAKYIFFKENMLPAYLILYVTSRCNLACAHCFFHKSLNNSNEISLADIEKISKSAPNLLNVSLTGGEPFLREDIDKIAGLFIKNSKASIISIPTNGMLADKIYSKVKLMLQQNPGTTFNVFVSIDGKEKTHNKIRGSKNAFSNANNTLKLLSGLRNRFGNFRLGVIFTINEFNSKEILPVYRDISGKYDLNHFQINFLRGCPKSAKHSAKEVELYSQANSIIDADTLAGKRNGHKIFGDFYTAVNKRYKQVIAKTVTENKFQIPCYAGTTNCVIYPNADVFACEIRDDLFLGNLKDFDFDLKKLLLTEKNRALLRSIREGKCFCTFECQQSSNVAFNIKELAKTLVLWAKLKLRLLP